jgi:murein DD-endopeptidase MepM/ murein hydrolase activator NlpD
MSCTPEQILTPPVNVTQTETLTATVASPATDIPATATSSPTETPIPCDPLTAEFCITEGHFVLQRPILPPGDDSVEGTYRFASTAAGTREAHHGVEFINGTGTPVHAAADGEVIFAGPDKEAVYSPWAGFYGNVVVIQHAEEMFTLYAHLSVMDVGEGQEVLAGQKIGEVGLTGSANGSHLHFEVRRGDGEDYFSALNPELWLFPRANEGVLAISIMDAKGGFRAADMVIRANEKSHFIKTYEEKFTNMCENAVLGELSQGRYRITFYFGGTFYERWVEVQSGKLTQTVIIVK